MQPQGASSPNCGENCGLVPRFAAGVPLDTIVDTVGGRAMGWSRLEQDVRTVTL